jgi:hypothetical protein
MRPKGKKDHASQTDVALKNKAGSCFLEICSIRPLFWVKRGRILHRGPQVRAELTATLQQEDHFILCGSQDHRWVGNNPRGWGGGGGNGYIWQRSSSSPVSLKTISQ